MPRQKQDDKKWWRFARAGYRVLRQQAPGKEAVRS
jgi:hypothetical protein